MTEAGATLMAPSTTVASAPTPMSALRMRIRMPLTWDPRIRANGRANTGPMMMRPTSRDTNDRPMNSTPPVPLTSWPATMNAALMANSTTPATTRPRDVADRSTASFRSAANGGTRPARMAGTNDDSRVTTMPTTNPSTARAGFSVSPDDGRSNPMTFSKPFSNTANTIPTTMPSTDDITATITDSRNWARMTCCLLAPMARSNAFSRLRWATTMAKAL